MSIGAPKRETARLILPALLIVTLVSAPALGQERPFSFFDQPEAMMRSVSEALKAGGRLLIVDFPRAGSPPNAEGVDPATVIATASRVGLTKVGESSVIPGHYAITFEKVR